MNGRNIAIIGAIAVVAVVVVFGGMALLEKRQESANARRALDHTVEQSRQEIAALTDCTALVNTLNSAHAQKGELHAQGHTALDPLFDAEIDASRARIEELGCA